MRKVSTKWPKIITCVCAVGIVMYIVTSFQSGVFSWNQFSIKLVTYGLWPVVLWSIWAFVCLVSEEKKQAVSQTTKAAKGQVKWLAFALLAVVLTAIIVVHFSNTPAATRADNRDVAEVYFNRGVAYLEEGAFDLAISDWSMAIEINPKLAEAYYNRGIAYYEKGEAVLAISDYTKAIEINPDYAEAYHNRGVAYDNEGARNLAISDYTKAIEVNPKLANVHYNRGFAYLEEGAFDLAISDYTKAIEINPAFAKAYCDRGVAYFDKEPVLAISDFNKAIEINPRYAEAYFFRGVTYDREGTRDLAISDWSKAIEINPREGQYYYYRGVAYATKDEFDKAWNDVHKAQDLGYQVSPEFIEQLRTLITLKRKSCPDFPQHTSRTPAPRPTGRKIDPREVVKTNVEQLKANFKNREEGIRKSGLGREEHNRIVAGMQNEYDQAKAKLIEIQSQFKLIDDLVKSGQIDSDAGYKAKMELAVPKAVFDAMFP